jgi:hypothetical protein
MFRASQLSSRLTKHPHIAHRGFGACTNALQTRSGPGPAKCSVSLAVWSADKELIRAAKW